nr:PREDICTED: protein piwi-like [Bemisia tabaci]XP_018904510.1 PREDICTED: protein piwi-like [Bemisia tabaci]XP_018904511.1 PREDICTED: protein piwi-like [Bemisia tabaci]
MSQQQSGGRGRARATSRGRAPNQPATQGRGGDPRRPGAERRPGQSAAPTPQPGPSAQSQQQPVFSGRAGSRKAVRDDASIAAGVSRMTISDTTSGGNDDNGNGIPIGRGALRGKRIVEGALVPAELMQTRNPSLRSKKGTSGAYVKLCANYFRLKSVTNWCLYHYNVSFNPSTEDRVFVKKQLIRDRLRELTQGTGFLFDGNSLFLSVKLPQDTMEFVAVRSYDEAQFQVTIQFTNDLQPSDYHYLQVFGILVRKCLGSLNLQLIGRNYFDKVAKSDIPRFNLSLWPGYITSIRQHEEDILMCAEITTKVMRQDTALELARSCRGTSGGNFQDAFKKAIIGISVMTRYNDRNYRVDDVDFSMNPLSEFDTKEGGKVKYVDYYKNKYNVIIKDLKQPLLVSKSKAREIRAGQRDFVYLVPELCLMTGLTDEMVSNIQLMKAVAEITRVGPGERIDRLMKLNERFRSVPQVVADLKQWNLSLDSKLVQFEGRILPAFKIEAGNKLTYPSGEHVDWTKELRSNAQYCSRDLRNWVVLVPDRISQNAQTFVGLVVKAAAGMKMKFAPPRLVTIQGDRISDYVTEIDRILSQGLPELLMCFLPNNKADRYAAIKKKCYVDRAVANQVILDRTTQNKGALSIATKVAIQMNCKMGGAPWAVPVPLKHLMVVGFDVNHDTNQKERSFGALVASLNNSYSRYFSAISAHKDGGELSRDFSLQMAAALRQYKQANNALPERIVIYRDGVGEGQIPYVKETEIAAVKHVLPQIYAGTQVPKLVVVVVTKRINTRIFTARGRNPEPGTVVDDVITFPHKYDFFLVSQTVRQGTVSPTSYNVIHDECDFAPDHLQRLTYALTHLYYNWSGTVRVPAPCQYAHKLAYLVGTLLHQSPCDGMKQLLYFL